MTQKELDFHQQRHDYACFMQGGVWTGEHGYVSSVVHIGHEYTSTFATLPSTYSFYTFGSFSANVFRRAYQQFKHRST